MVSGGEEELWLAQSETLRDPRPDVSHLLGTDDLRGEGVGVKSQLHISPGDNEETQKGTESEVVYKALKSFEADGVLMYSK